jgi:hypothetical protein
MTNFSKQKINNKNYGIGKEQLKAHAQNVTLPAANYQLWYSLTNNK